MCVISLVQVEQVLPVKLSWSIETSCAPFKKFDIPHPSKEKGHQLGHVSLERPRNRCICKRRVKGTNEIELPDYWKDLVDEDSITVQLTPIGSHQSLCYKTSILVK